MKRDVLKKLFLNIMFYGVMFLYALILFFLLFKKKSVGSFQTINLIPFRTIIDYLFNEDVIVRSFAFSNIMGNIAIFIPNTKNVFEKNKLMDKYRVIPQTVLDDIDVIDKLSRLYHSTNVDLLLKYMRRNIDE